MSYKRKRQGSSMPSIARAVQMGVMAASKAANMYSAYRGAGNEVSGKTQGFLNFGDRGTQNVVQRSRKRRRMTKPMKKRYRKARAFKTKVRKVMRQKQAISCLNEQWSGSFDVNSVTPGTFGTPLGNLNRFSQLIIGNNRSFGINVGGRDNQESENNWIVREQADYLVTIQDTPGVINPKIARRQASSTFQISISAKKFVLTLENTNDVKDVIFNIYECVAAQDITDETLSTPVRTWQTLQLASEILSTDAQLRGTDKGDEPTDTALFGKYWKILKKTKVRLPPASAEQGSAVVYNYQTFAMYASKMIWRSRYNELYAVKGKTKYFMIVFDPDLTPRRYNSTAEPAEQVCRMQGFRSTHYRPMLSAFQAPISTANGLHKFIPVPTS